MNPYQFIFENIVPERQEMLIALLANIGFDGFEEDDKALKAFIPTATFDEDMFHDVIELIDIKYSKSILEEVNWNQRWETGFEPVIVPHPTSLAAFAAVRANFHAVIPGVPYDLLVTPKMSFGTGHHATTYLMMQQMSLLDFNSKEVIDFGTGTGVLAILAEKLGATKITAIDNDEWSINNSIENIDANSCTNIIIVKGETIEAGITADIILANINLNIIIGNLEAIKTACKTGTSILISGIMQKDEEEIITLLKENNFIIKTCLEKDNWLIILARTE
ncbi:MAG: 50S ribosomal protein L11 methyltransferase [Ferruginibacter sp.]